MKKYFVLISFWCLSLVGFTQELGIRFGDALGNAAAIDAVFSTGEFNRIHADVTFGSGVGVEVLWDFINRPLSGEAFSWYAGAGVSTRLDDPFVLGACGEVGLEYRFNTVPIALGIDWRPVFVLVENTDFRAEGFGFNARYIFGKK